MDMHKVNSPDEKREFVVTEAYQRLYSSLKNLKNVKGRIIHVVGAPGTGKSTNIYEAINNLNLDVYDAGLILGDVDRNSWEVYQDFFKSLKKDMGVKSKEELYEKLTLYDGVLFADRFHDSQYIYDGKVGFSLWVDYKGLKTFPIYLFFISYYLRNVVRFRRVNLIFQTAWKIHIRGVKYDLFTDFGLFSKFLTGFLRIFFEVVDISYTESEIIEIVEKRLPDVDEEQIKLYIKKYGSRIRFILMALEADSLNR